MTRILLAWVFFTIQITASAAPSSTRVLTGASVKNGSGQININSSGTLTLPNATDTVVGRATTDTLTNKTLTSPVINSPTGLVKADVGLGNVDNTSDATKNAATATLTNKTIDGDDNTVQDLAITALKTSLADANKFLVRDVSGVPTSSTKDVPSGAVVGTTDTQTLSGKTFSDSVTLAEIATPSTPASGFGSVYFKNDGKLYQLNDDGAESAVGAGSSSGSFNYIENFGWESNALDWTASGGTYARTTTAAQIGSGAGAGSWDSNAASQTLTSDAVTIYAGAYGQNGVVSCKFKAASGTATHLLQAYDGTNVLASQTITSDTSGYPRTNVNFIFPSSGNIQARIVSVASNEPALYIDDCYLGLAEGFNVSQVSQASLYGTAKQDAGANCDFTQNTSSGLTNWVDLGTAGSCAQAWTTTGGVTAVGATSHQITMNNMPPGAYRIVVKGVFFNSGTNIDANYRLHDGTSALDGVLLTNSTSAFIANELSAVVTYTTGGSRTFKIQSADGGTTTSGLYNSGTGRQIVWNVYRFPTSAETAIAANVNSAGGTAVYPNGTGKAVSGTSTSWTTFSDADFPTGRTFQGQVVAPSTSNDLGVQSAGALPAGRYLVVFSGPLFNSMQGATTSTTCNFAISDGTTRGPVIDSFSIDDGTHEEVHYLNQLSATFEYSSAAQRNFVVQYRRQSGDGFCGADMSARENAASMTIIPLSQNLPVPILVGSVTSNSTGAERVERARIGGAVLNTNNCTSDPCTIHQQSGSWVSSVARASTGTYTINIASGLFSGTPSCQCSAVEIGASRRICTTEGTTGSATSITVVVYDFTGTVKDAQFTLNCQGPR